jgi:hypothetical protein
LQSSACLAATFVKALIAGETDPDQWPALVQRGVKTPRE